MPYPNRVSLQSSTSRSPSHSHSDSDVSAANPGSNKRKRLYVKRVRHENSAAYEEEDLPRDKAFVRELRWHYLLNFNIAGFEELIDKVYNTTDRDSFTWSEAYQTTQRKFKNWKSVTLKNVKVRILYYLLLFLHTNNNNGNRITFSTKSQGHRMGPLA
jgi:hypothetical protein